MMNYLLNISSNYRAKFFIGTALNLLSDCGDMFVSDVFSCPDRKGTDADYFNVCVQITVNESLEQLHAFTKSIEKKLGRGSKVMPTNAMPIDIDVLAHAENNIWVFHEKYLPLTADVQLGLADIEVVIDDIPCHKITIKPKKQDWWSA